MANDAFIYLDNVLQIGYEQQPVTQKWRGLILIDKQEVWHGRANYDDWHQAKQEAVERLRAVMRGLLSEEG